MFAKEKRTLEESLGGRRFNVSNAVSATVGEPVKVYILYKIRHQTETGGDLREEQSVTGSKTNTGYA